MEKDAKHEVEAVQAEEAAPNRELVERFEPLIEDLELPDEKAKQVRRIVRQVTRVMSFQGPVPPPDLLRMYEEILPGSADRLFRLTEKQTDHRIAMEGALVRERVALSKTGQWMAFWLSIFFGAIAGVLGYNSHEVVATAIVVTTIVGLAVVFVLGRKPTASKESKQGDSEEE